MTEPSHRSVVDDIRALAATSVAEAAVAAEQALDEIGEIGELLYLLAELRARSGRADVAIDLIDRAERAFRLAGAGLEAERCAIGRITVLDDLGRHDEAEAIATGVIDRLLVSGGGDHAGIDPSHATLAVGALSNRALCRETTGDYAGALDDYDRAIGIASVESDPLLRAQLEINRVGVLDLLGRARDAVAGLRRAIPLLEELGERDDVVKAAANLGAMLCRLGDYDEGLTWLSQAEQLVEPGTDDACGILVETADALANLGAVDEAVRRYRDALAILAHSPISWLEGRAWLGLGICLGRDGDDVAARTALRTAIDAFEASGNLPLTVASLLELARIEAADQAFTALALDQLRRALALADEDRWPVQACVAQLRLGELTSGTEAERWLRSALRLAERARLLPLTMRARQQLGHHLLARGRSGDAREHVESAVEIAESLRSRLNHHSLLRMFPTETVSCYDDLVALRLADGDVEGAFTAADRGRSRSILDLRRLAVREGRPEVVELEVELDVLYDRLLGAGEATSLRERRLLEDRARELELLLERARFDLLPGPSPTHRDVGRNHDAPLVGVDAVLVYHRTASGIGVFLRRDGRTTWHPDLVRPEAVADELERFHADGRRAWALRSARVAVDVPAVAVTAERRTRRLGEMLLGPLAESLAGIRAHAPLRVVVAPTGPLWSVPFAALGVPASGTALVDVAVVSTTPSPTLAVAGSPPATGPSLVVGIQGGGVPAAATEAARVAARLGPGCALLVDDDATLDAVRRHPRPAVLHLATHGVHRERSPLQSGVRLADGWLTASRAAALDLEGSVVVLSACDTGASTVGDGDEILGAQYGFLLAGAHHVVMSLWPAHDEMTADLMDELHRALGSGTTAATAVRTAQLAQRERTPHPWWWSGFVASGAI